MSETRNPGCALWAALAMLVSMIFAISGTQLTTNSATLAATPTPSVLIATVVPQETDTYFMVENNQITYSYFHTLGMPCYYLIGGKVFDLQGRPFEGFVVNIQMIGIEEGAATPAPGYGFPYKDGGVLLWDVLLPSWSVDYEIWLTTKKGGAELSPHIYVPTRDCEHNNAQINFVQVKPLPANLP